MNELPSRLEIQPRLGRVLRLVGLVSVLLATALSAARLQHGIELWWLVLPPLLVVLAVVAWKLAGTLVLDQRTVRLETPLFHHRIDWNEVERVRIDRDRSAIVFEGSHRRLVVPGPIWWGAVDRDLGMRWIENVAGRFGLEIETDRWAPYRWCQNTRRRRKGLGR